MRDQEFLALHREMFGSELHGEESPEKILALLRQGKSNISLSLYWHDQQSYHYLTLSHLDESGNVYFFNPDHLNDPDQKLGPSRQRHEAGEESVCASEFASWFLKRDALAYLSVDLPEL